MKSEAFKAGFYAGQAYAGIELYECHQNWERFNEPDLEPKPRGNKYGKHKIPKSWKLIENSYVWFDAFHHGMDWRGVPGYLYEKPDGTFVAPFRGELVEVVWDAKNEYREIIERSGEEAQDE